MTVASLADSAAVHTAPVTGLPVRNYWVLHKQIAVRLLAFVLVVLAGTVLLVNRQAILNYTLDLAKHGSTLFSHAGLSVAQISLSGYALTEENTIFQAIGLEPGESLVGFDVRAAREHLLALPSIASVSVRKIYPNRLIVEIDEIQPRAVWNSGDESFAIDGEGNQIAKIDAPLQGLPLFVGAGAPDHIGQMLILLEARPVLMNGLMYVARIGDRRWDLVYENDIRMMLPEAGVSAAMATATTLVEDYRIFDRDISLIDLRSAEFIVIRPGRPDDMATDKDS